MYDPERGWSLSFVGCGFLGFYHVGVTRCLSERAPHLLRDARMFYGASAGALHCATFLAGVPLDQIIESFADFSQTARKRSLGPLHPFINMSKNIREQLHKHLPANVHQLISGKMCISLTRLPDLENVLVSDFQSKDEVVDALVCSTFLPFFSGLIPPSFRGVRYMDGGVTDNVPFIDANTTITISPFYGEHDICPKVKSTKLPHMTISKLSLYLCSGNAYLILRALFHPDLKVLGEMCFQGYLDALRFLEEQGICTRPGPGLNLSSEESESEVMAPCWENRGLEPRWEAAALETRPEEDELLDHLHVSMWESLPPKLAKALREAMEDRGGFRSKLCGLFPLRLVSYVLLPCTLPVESAVSLVQRLVMWLPDMADDIQWLWWATSQIYSHLMASLLPTSRSPAPAPGHQAVPHGPEHERCCRPPHASRSLGAGSGDRPEGLKAAATQQSCLKSDLAFFSGSKVAAGMEGGGRV